MLRHRNEYPVEGQLPGLSGATAWLNSAPVVADALQGRVVLVSFGTYTCINWIRSLPYVRAWADKYAGPGAGGHRGADARVRLREGPRRRGRRPQGRWTSAIPWRSTTTTPSGGRSTTTIGRPCTSSTSRAGSATTASARGTTRSPSWCCRCCWPRPASTSIARLARLEPQGVELPAEWDHLGSPETYVGYQRRQGFASPGGVVPDQRHRYTPPPSLGRNQWALSGDWRIGPVAAVLEEPGGAIACAFHARDLHLVMRPAVPHTSVPFRVRIDGQPPGPAHGLDVDEDGNGTVSDQRLYQLIRQPGPIVDRRFEIEFLDAGVEAFVFTFG